MKVTIRTNDDDWRELSTEGLEDIGCCGHEVPEFIWTELLQAAGVEVEIIFTNFELTE